MARARRSAVPSSFKNDIAALKRRVSWLEAALKPKPKRGKAPVDKVWAHFERRKAEMNARSKALEEYRDREHEKRLRENPMALRIAIESERRENEFMRSKGLSPSPSHIPKSLRRKAKAP